MMKHLLKRVWLLSVVLIGTIVCLQFVGVDIFSLVETYAQSNQNEFNFYSDTQREMASKLQLFVRLIYLLMRPLLAVAWATMDNNMVFGRAFFLETSLWNMRQVMRNFANFALWWLFLFALLRNIFVSMKGDEDPLNGTWWIKSIIPKLLIATILIQSSFFMMRAIVDIAQAATYTVGTLPLTSIKKWDGIENIRFMKPLIQYSLDDTKAANGSDATFSIFYTCNAAPKDKPYFIPCMFDNNAWVPDWERNTAKTWINHKWNEAQTRAQLNGKETDEVVFGKINDTYCVLWNSIVLREEDKSVDVCQLAKLREDAKKANGCESWCTMHTMWCAPLSKFMDNAAGMTWPLYGLYASILRMDQIALTPKHLDTVEMSVQFMVKLFIALALVLPLLALAVALVIRMVAIRWFVIFSPFLVLWRVFLADKWEWITKGKGTLTSLISLVFMPVIVVFAISISLIFLTLIWRADELNVMGSSKWVGHNIGTQMEPWMSCDRTTWIITCPGWWSDCGKVNSRCYDLAGMTSLCFSEWQTSFGNTILNVMSYLLLNFFGIALMWMVVFSALKANKITGGIVWWIESLGKDLAKNIPILPWPKQWLSFNEIKWRAAGVSKGIQSMWWGDQAASLDRAVDKFKKKRSGDTKQLTANMWNVTDADSGKNLIDQIGDNTHIKTHWTNGMKALAAATWATWATSISEIAWSRKWYNGLRELSDDNNIENITWKLDKTYDKEISSEIRSDIKSWLDTLAKDSTENKMYNVWKDTYYDQKHSELIEIANDKITRTVIPWSLWDMKEPGSIPKRVNPILTWELILPDEALPTWLKAVKDNAKGSWETVIFEKDGTATDKKTLGEDQFAVVYGEGWIINSIKKWVSKKQEPKKDSDG